MKLYERVVTIKWRLLQLNPTVQQCWDQHPPVDTILTQFQSPPILPSSQPVTLRVILLINPLAAEQWSSIPSIPKPANGYDSKPAHSTSHTQNLFIKDTISYNTFPSSSSVLLICKIVCHQASHQAFHTDRNTARSGFAIYKVFCPYDYYTAHPENPAKLNKISNLHPHFFIRWKIYKWRTTDANYIRGGPSCLPGLRICPATSLWVWRTYFTCTPCLSHQSYTFSERIVT